MLCVLVFLFFFNFMLSVLVQLIAWKDHLCNDLLCVKRDVKHLLTHSLADGHRLHALLTPSSQS